MESVVICAAPTGARRGKADHPAIPITPDEIARVAASCAAAGAQALHLHVRADDDSHSLDPDRYRAAIAAVRAEAGDAMIVQVTTEAVERFTRQEQMAAMRALVPEAMSMAVRELIPDDASEPEAAAFLAWALTERIGLQFIVYTPDDAERLKELVRRGVVPDTPHALFVLGRYTPGQRSEPRDLHPFLVTWPTAWPWTVCAFGPLEAQCLAEAIELGGHVRVGFENNLYRPDGTLADDNAEQVAAMRRIVERSGRPLASVTDARRLYGAPAAASAGS